MYNNIREKMKNMSEATDRQRFADVISNWVKNLSQDPLLLNHHRSSSGGTSSSGGKRHVRRQSDFNRETNMSITNGSDSNSNDSSSSDSSNGVTATTTMYNQQDGNANDGNKNDNQIAASTTVWSV